MAALLGVGIAETLNKLVVRMSRPMQLSLVVIGIVAGAILGSGMRFVVQGKWDLAMASIVPVLISLAIVLLAVFFRFRTN